MIGDKTSLSRCTKILHCEVIYTSEASSPAIHEWQSESWSVKTRLSTLKIWCWVIEAEIQIP